MAITDYSSLKTAVASWLHRSDLTDIIPDFITFAEKRLSADLNARPMEARATPVCTVGNANLALPSGLLEIRRALVVGDPSQVLNYMTPDQIATDYPTSLSGKPSVFAVIGENMQLAPIPDSDYSIELTYRQSIPALSIGSPTNWLLTAFPNAYLYGTLCEAQPYMIDDARLAVFKTLYREAVDSINAIDWYSGSTMRVRAR